MFALPWGPGALGTASSGGGLGAAGRGGSAAAPLTPSVLPASVPEDGVGGDPRAGWQLLTAHDNGQVLVWNAAADHLQPVCKLGETGSPVRTVASLDAFGLICTAHANGELALFPRAQHASDWGGGGMAHGASSSSGGSGHPSASGAGAQPPSAAAAGPTTAVGIACVRPRRLVLRAHRSSITAAGASAGGVATASNQGTLRLWRAADLAREAERAGLLAGLPRRTTTSAASAALSIDRWAFCLLYGWVMLCWGRWPSVQVVWYPPTHLPDNNTQTTTHTHTAARAPQSSAAPPRSPPTAPGRTTPPLPRCWEARRCWAATG
jgi:hypothetical protein